MLSIRISWHNVYILLSINLRYSATFEFSSELSTDSAYILTNGSVPLGLTITHVSSSIQILAPSRVSIFFGLPCSKHIVTMLLAICFVGHLNLVLYLNIFGNEEIICDNVCSLLL